MGGAIACRLRFLAIGQSPDIQWSAARELGREEVKSSGRTLRNGRNQVMLFKETDFKMFKELGNVWEK